MSIVVASVIMKRRRNRQMSIGERRKVGKNNPTVSAEEREHIEAMMKKYDMDGDTELNFGELKALMVDLNDGKEVLDIEVKCIMKNADSSKNFHISNSELQKALTAW
eukprot:CAMPEP_0118935258 /NCGR_PEP_ID=MMETSP1169-20130426/15280_1 /TAXON_ID=36882 /ORGANISM="Pyramimonas obovata, Strain CCMP722" /LENGTH=106 /DNA_ID=CAMNT_0006878267 /DNA_START=170 /DNA_END=487 /DNA_ORIENTATION=+